MNENELQAKEIFEIFDQLFKGNTIRAKCINYVVGNSSSRIYVEVYDESHIKHVKKMIQKVSATMNNFPIAFFKEVAESDYSAIDFSNLSSETLEYEEMFGKLPDSTKYSTSFPLGKGIEGDSYLPELRKMKNILIGGNPATGKTNLINNIISTLIKRNTPEQIRLVLMDPTRFEMNIYNDDPHLLCPIIKDPVTCEVIIYEMVDIMNKRYKLFEEGEHQTNIEEYNTWAKEHNKEELPYIVIVLNEYSMFAVKSKEINIPLTSLLQKSYAAGIITIISTKNAKPHIINEVMKNSLTTRIAFPVSNVFESNSFVDIDGAEKLISGGGDMLVKSSPICKKGILLINTPFISTEEIYEIVKKSKEKYYLSYHDSLLKVISKNNSSNIKETFLNDKEIDKDNEGRVTIWAYDQGIVTIEKMINELGINKEKAEHYIKVLYDDGIILKTLEPGIYRVIEDD